MSKNEQKKLVEEICRSLAESVIADIDKGKIPERWDGIELRQLLADRVVWHNMPNSRKRDYKNTIMVNGL